MLHSLIILDGFAVSKDTYGNAIIASGTPNIKKLMETYPNTIIGASGLDVGLPEGQMGNSEVGHINMGAGRTVYQELTRITKSISDGDFYTNKELLSAVHYARDNNKNLHTFGLLSDGGVHSTLEHLFALILLAKREGVANIFVHCFMDGRDVSPTSGSSFLAKLQDFMDVQKFGTIASVIGRFYAMDRDNRWERVQKGYEALVDGIGHFTTDPIATVNQSYADGITDEFIAPTIVTKNGAPIGRIAEGDSIVFFNFRPDRAREISRAFTEQDFNSFKRIKGCLNPKYVGFTQYDISLTHVGIAFPAQKLTNNLGQILAKNNLKQLRIAETEKYAHVTFFFNSGVEAPNEGEDRVLIPSPKVATYDLQPQMSAMELANRAVELILSNKYDVMVLNFANCDMVGHTGNFDATVIAVNTVDIALKMVTDAIKQVGGKAIITADHGNADKMYEKDGSPFTPHTTNPVPVILLTNDKVSLRNGGTLADIAPTLLDMMGIQQPEEMTGKSLIL